MESVNGKWYECWTLLKVEWRITKSIQVTTVMTIVRLSSVNDQPREVWEFINLYETTSFVCRFGCQGSLLLNYGMLTTSVPSRPETLCVFFRVTWGGKTEPTPVNKELATCVTTQLPLLAHPLEERTQLTSLSHGYTHKKKSIAVTFSFEVLPLQVPL